MLKPYLTVKDVIIFRYCINIKQNKMWVKMTGWLFAYRILPSANLLCLLVLYIFNALDMIF